MSRWVPHLLVLAATLVLVLPPRWCCTAPVEAEAAQPKAACPHCVAEKGPASGNPQQDSHCDGKCQVDAAPAPGSHGLDLAPLVASLFSPPELPQFSASIAAELQAMLLPPGPRLHLLKCVLRC